MVKKEVHKNSHYQDLKQVKKDPDLMQKNLEATNKLIVRIDKMLSLFEEASKHIAEVESTEAKVKALADKLDSLVEQNKAIAQGLLLLEKYVRGRTRLEGISQPNQ